MEDIENIGIYVRVIDSQMLLYWKIYEIDFNI